MIKNKSKRKVLIVSFLFPPANTIGAVRIGKFAKYLPEFGWEPVVLTVDKVKGLPQNLPVEIDEAKIIRTPYFALSPFVNSKLLGDRDVPAGGRLKSMNWRANTYHFISLARSIYIRPEITFFTDESWGWYPYALKMGLRVISKSKVDVIFSTFGPRLPHLVASQLHKRTGIPWVAEYRDLWTQNHYFKKIQPFQFLEQRFEKLIMKTSSLLLTVSEPLAKELEALHSKKVVTIHNGFDENDYTEDVPLTPTFTITYTGNIYPGKQDPTPLLRAIAEISEDGTVFPQGFEVRFFGGNGAETLSPIIEKYHLHDVAKVCGLVPFKESIKRQKESTVLLLLGWNDTKVAGILTGKIFEYMGAGRPILALAFKSGEIDNILSESGCGVVANEISEIKGILAKWLEEFKQYGEIVSFYHPNDEIIKKYTRREQAKKLAEAFHNVIN